MTDALDFSAPLWRPEGTGTSTFITLPFDVRSLFGRARCPVRVTVNGHTWRTTTQVHDGEYRIAVNAQARSAAGVEAGDRVHVAVKKDDSLRATDVPTELAACLRADAEAKDAFEALAPSHRREYARWVGEAKQAQTRQRRAAAATQRLKASVRPARTA